MCFAVNSPAGSVRAALAHLASVNTTVLTDNFAIVDTDATKERPIKATTVLTDSFVIVNTDATKERPIKAATLNFFGLITDNFVIVCTNNVHKHSAAIFSSQKLAKKF